MVLADVIGLVTETRSAHGVHEAITETVRDVLAEIRDGNYLFGEPGAPVAAMTERKAGAPRLVNGEEAEMRFRTMFFDPVNDAFRMMVLSFPALRFC